MTTKTRTTALPSYDGEVIQVHRKGHQMLLSALADIASPRQRVMPLRGSPSKRAWLRTGTALRRAMLSFASKPDGF